MANAHKRQSQIQKMRINGVWFTEKNFVRQNIVAAFEDLLKDPRDWRANFDGLSFSRLSELDATNLEVPFSLEEVHSALSDLNGDKALGPDGQLSGNAIGILLRRM